MPKETGVYILLVTNIKTGAYEIKYIGSCINFKSRMCGHEPAWRVNKDLKKSERLDKIQNVVNY